MNEDNPFLRDRTHRYIDPAPLTCVYIITTFFVVVVIGILSLIMTIKLFEAFR